VGGALISTAACRCGRNPARVRVRGPHPCPVSLASQDLDEGPIIEQDTIRVTHAQSAEDYVSLGRDVEAQALARAIHAHVQRRAFLNGGKSVVFPASPGAYASERMG